VDDNFAHRTGAILARDCILQAPGPDGSRSRDLLLAAARERCGVERDRSLGFALDEVERVADTGRLASAEAILAFVDELEQNAPVGLSGVRALLSGLRDGAQRYGEQWR